MNKTNNDMETKKDKILEKLRKLMIDDFLSGEKIGRAKSISSGDIDSISAMKGMKVGENIEISKGIYTETVPKELRVE